MDTLRAEGVSRNWNPSMPGGAACEHKSRRRDCAICCGELCEHRSVPRRCRKCTQKSKPRARAGEMWLPGFGYLTTMESMQSAITGGPVMTCATQSALHQSSAAMPSAMASLLPKGKSQCSLCIERNLERLGAAHAWREVMTQAEAACALDCGACGERVFPTTARGAVALHGTKPEVQRPHELALWHMKRHAADDLVTL